VNFEQLVFVDFDELLEIHGVAIQQAGGSDGVRDRGLLESSPRPNAALLANLRLSDARENGRRFGLRARSKSRIRRR
jgi:hypothetical protein